MMFVIIVLQYLCAVIVYMKCEDSDEGIRGLSSSAEELDISSARLHGGLADSGGYVCDSS